MSAILYKFILNFIFYTMWEYVLSNTFMPYSVRVDRYKCDTDWETNIL
jgi:hypothetical protein